MLELKATSKLLADQLDAFVNVIEAMGDALSEDHEAQALEYIEKAHLAIDRAERLAIKEKGEARKLVRRYPVTEENYEPAVNLLQKKYGNDAQLISALRSRLESARAENSTTQAQRKLLETIIPIVTQLRKLKIDLNGSYNAQKVLAKFALRIQRRVLESQITPDMVESQWKMEEIIAELDANITMEEHVNDMVTKNATVTTRTESANFHMRQGADQSFINQALAEDLGLTCTEIKEFNMYTFGTRDPVPTTCGVTFLDLWDNMGEKHNVRLHATAVLTAKGKLTYLSQQDLDFIAHNKIQLSKVTKRKQSKPQILLGCDQLCNLLEVPSPRCTLPSGLLLIPSKLGYLLTGRQQMTATLDPQSSMVTMIQTLTNEEEDLQRWDRYWTMESAGVCEFIGTKDAEKSAINDKVLQFFNDTIEKRDDGYYVRLPFKQDQPPLPTNKELLEDYDDTFKTQLDSGIIEEIPEEQEEGDVVHYIPHQPVITPHKETTKLRIVFDASSHFKDCPSLNDVLYQGPLILPELYAMLLRFRIPKYVITSDVEKAFLQVHLHELDRDATRFFWVRDYRKDPTEDKILTYRFNRVTFGLNVSPFLLGATVHYHLRNAIQDKELEKEIRENLYVDNLILAAETKQEALRKSTDSRKIFADVGMNLREFLSNDHFISEGIHKEACATNRVQMVLGITWDSDKDIISIRCDFPSTHHLTKRIVARQIASIYDPFGWLVPLLTQPKRFQQDLWKQKFAWDTDLPKKIKEEWDTITNNAHGFQKSFSRQFFNKPECGSLAIFADASGIAMPTIPKMEMNALTLATRLAFSIFQAMETRLIKRPWDIYIFSDSQIALAWLSTSTNDIGLGLLVNNRLKEMRKIVKALNEAGNVHAVIAREEYEPVTSILDWDRFSSFNKDKQATVRVLIFVRKLVDKLPTERKNTALERVPELKHIPYSLDDIGGNVISASRRALICNHQSIHLQQDYRKSMENTLRLFKDSEGIWRSKGRVGNSALDNDAKNPAFITPKTALADLIIKEAHGTFHRGVEHTIATVRLQYWIPKLRQQVRHIVKNCVKCRRFNGLPYAYPATDDLPDRRVIRSHPFQHIGLDFFDLPVTKEGSEQIKTYGYILICTVTQMIHLELVLSMSTEDFLNVLRRFIARRGVPTTITSDNAATFLLSAEILATGATTPPVNSIIRNTVAQLEIEWKNITPYAPWQGGFYERLIKSIKHALYKSLKGKPHHSIDNLRTVLTEIEACLNSRPLTYQGSELDTLSSIRPIDFLQHDLILTFPYDATSSKDDPDYLPPERIRGLATKREAEQAFQSSCQNTEHFWNVWQQNYFTSLREMHRKYISSQRHHHLIPKVGTVVLLCDPLLHRNEWKLARITQTNAGRDGQIREVELITSTKRKIKRPINLIVPLELNDDTATLDNGDPTAAVQEDVAYAGRPRQYVSYTNNVGTATSTQKACVPSRKWFLFYLMLLSLFRSSKGATAGDMKITCTEEGVLINTYANTTFELCADTLCKIYTPMAETYVVKLLPEVTLHDHVVSMKWKNYERLSVMETSMNAYEELARLRRICNAIPTLPKPVVVYNKIIHGSVTLQITVRSMNNLRDRLKAVRTSDKGWQERLTQLELVEAVRDKLHVEFALIRSDLRTLYAVIPLLIATDAISKRQWDELINRPQYDDVGKPATVKQGKLELIISDQIDLLEETRLSIVEEEKRNDSRLRKSGKRKAHDSARDRDVIRRKCPYSRRKLSRTESYDITSVASTESSTQNPSQEHSREGEGIIEEMHEERDEIPRLVGDDDSDEESEQMEEEEGNIIWDNEQFIEGFDAMEEEDEEEPEDEEALRLAAQRAQRRRQIENEIHQTEQGVLGLEDIVNSLCQEQSCAPRNYERGATQHDDEQTLRCVFCGRIGDHYSDSCIAHRNIMERRLILDAQRRCGCCLEIEFSHHVCRKANLPCYHCRARGHHSSLCDLPERSEDIRNRIHQALESRRMALDKIRELQRELQELN
ncbi:hypothetical protein RB195_011585 [Necator americanus]|uniref:Integrase catalytic domain-containing protein n=1 Tax=Necator americanus TaxID=51031 RepID=A0ABR1D340_NECAM